MNNKVIEKEEAYNKLKNKITEIKQKYGLEFDPSILENNSLYTIKFYNLEYKKSAKNLTVVYYNEYNRYGALLYDVVPGHTMKNHKFETIISELQKKYKLFKIINEVKDAVYTYKEEMINIENKYNDSISFENDISSNLTNKNKEESE